MIKPRKAQQARNSSKQIFLPRNNKEKSLIKAFAMLKNEKDTAAFLRDLLTTAEIEEFANRLEIARLLLDGKSYQEAAKATNTSTTTVTRVARWLFHGCAGYMKVLKQNKSLNAKLS